MTDTIHSARALAEGTAALTGQVGAVEWKDEGHTEIRLYCPTQESEIREYRWQGGDPWTQGTSLPQTSLASRAAAVHWHNGKDGHLRVYCQSVDVSDGVAEWCYDPPNWTGGQTFTGALPGTAIAALAIYNYEENSIHLVLFYQAANGKIVQYAWNGNEWGAIHAFEGARQSSGIAAIYFIDDLNDPHMRLYYQDTGNRIVEQRWDGDQWAQGHTFTGATAGTAIAAAHWWDSTWDNQGSSHLRLYYMNDTNRIVEQCYDTPTSWTPGHSFAGVATGTGIAAVAWHDSDRHVRLYYEDTTSALIEQCYDEGEWTRGTFVATVS